MKEIKRVREKEEEEEERKRERVRERERKREEEEEEEEEERKRERTPLCSCSPPYLAPYCSPGRKVELSCLRKVSKELIVELPELSKPSVHIPLIVAELYEHLVDMVGVRATPFLDHGRDPYLHQPV